MQPPAVGTVLSANQVAALTAAAPAPAAPVAPAAPTVSVGQTLSPDDIAKLGKAEPVPQKSINPLANIATDAVAGMNQGGTGINEVFEGVDQGNKGDLKGGIVKIGKGALDTVSGGLSEAFSPITGIIDSLAHIPIGDTGENVGDRIEKNGIQPIANIIADFKPLQDFMVNNPDADKVAGNLINIGLALAGGGKTPEIKAAAGDAASTLSSVVDKATAPLIDMTKKISDQLPKLNPTEQDIIDKRVGVLQQIENNSGPVRRVVDDATNRGVDVKKLVANTDLLQNSVDENGNLSTMKPGESFDQFKQFMNKYESAVSDALDKEGKSIPVADVEKMMNDRINQSNIAGGSKTRLTNFLKDEIAGLKLDANPDGMISLSKLQDAKISTTDGIDYTNLGSKKYAKLVANVYKTAIESESGLPVRKINAELSKFYKIGDYLEGLNGRKVAGGRLGKYFAQTVGSIAGSHFGPLGSIIGAELASKIKGSAMESTFADAINKNLEASPLMKETVVNNTLPRTALPAPAEGAAKVQNNVPINAGPESTIEAPAGSISTSNSKARSSVAQAVEKSQLKQAEKDAILKFLNEPHIAEKDLPVIKAGKKKGGTKKSDLPTIK